jgi:hypothetical protein
MRPRLFNPVTSYGVSKVPAKGDLQEMATHHLLRSGTVYDVSSRPLCDIVLYA